jgi:hypothetical protein
MIQGQGFRVQGLGCMAWGCFMIYDSWFRVKGFGV